MKKTRWTMRTGRRSAALVALVVGVVVVALSVGVGPAAASPASPGGSTAKTAAAAGKAAAQPAAANDLPATCNAAQKNVGGKVFAQCFAMIRTALAGQVSANAAAPPPTALGPAQIQDAYKLPGTGGGQTVGIVDAFGDSTAEADLGVFRSQFGLPACTTANGCFQKVDENGGTSYPPDDSGWALETSLDLDAVSAACPACHILLVEGTDNSLDNLGIGVNTAVSLGAKFVSNSYGVLGETSIETGLDHYYDHPGVAVTASTGDAGGVTNWPATSPNVTGVGGTTLTQDSSPRGWHETAWAEGGSGCSPFEPHPDYQNGIATNCPNNKAIADVSADADPASGLAVYDTIPYQGETGWFQVGGTSLSSPLTAAMYALAGTPVAGTYPVTYPYQAPAGSLNDVTAGSNGGCGNVLCNAGPGWDGPTGLGTPNGVSALTTGPHGNIAGTVTDAGTSAPISGATLTTQQGYTATTDSSGHYSITLPVGSYSATYSRFGYASDTEDNVAVTDGGTTTVNVALHASPAVTVSGTITDGSGHGWPLYTEISVAGDPNGPIFTNPVTGQYSMQLPANAGYDVTFTPQVPGYQATEQTVAVGGSNMIHNVAVPVALDCMAPGYQINFGTSVFNEPFDGASFPAGWTVVDNVGQGHVWQIGDPENRGNLTGGSGNFADINSDFYGAGNHQDTSLISPAIDLSSVATPVLRFHNEYNGFSGQTADVDFSTDGGTTWSNIWHHGSDGVRGPDLEEVAFPQAGGHNAVQLRFHFTSTFGWWWQVDDVSVLGRSCDPVPGGLVEGNVSDLNTGTAINGATVTSVDKPAENAKTSATPDDSNNPDGFYWLFSSLTGSHAFTAGASKHADDTETVNVAANGAVRQDFQLKAPHLTVTPTSLSSTQVLGQTATKTLSFHNDGTAPAHVKLSEQGGSFQILGSHSGNPSLAPASAGQFSPRVNPGPTSFLADSGKRGANSVAAPDSPDWQSGAPVPAGLVRYAYAQCADQPDSYYVISGVSNGNLVNTNYRYDATTNSWTTLAPIPTGQEAPAAACLDDRIYVMGGGGTNQMFIYDIASNTWGSGAPLPQAEEGAVAGALDGKVYLVGGDDDFTPGDGVYDTVLIYDIPSNTWSTGATMPTASSNPGGVQVGNFLYVAGGWGTSAFGSNITVTQRYDMSADTWETGPTFTPAKADFALAASGSALYAIGGDNNGGGFADATTSVARLDLSGWPGGTWTDLGDPLPAPRVANEGGFCTTALTGGETWSVGGADSNLVFHSDTYYRTSGEGCGAGDVKWLAESPVEFDVPVGGTVTVTVTFSATTDAGVTQPGTFTAHLAMATNAPQKVDPVGVTMNVTPPNGWGELAGTLSGLDCNNKTGPLKGVVFATGKSYSFTLKTNADGSYVFWAPSASNPFSLVASASGWIAQTQKANVRVGKVTTINFTLRPVTC